MSRVFFCLLACSALSFGSLMSQEIVDDQTMKLDVVELVAGREVEGKKEFQVDHEGFRYFFGSESTKKLFGDSPQKYQIQMDGGCGRMGSLSGRGKTSFWAVHKKRLYIFASEDCRTGFSQAPNSMLERDDARPKFSDEAIAVGKTMLSRVIRFSGGRRKIDELNNCVLTRSEKVVSGEKTYLNKVTRALDFANDRIRFDDAWDNKVFTKVATRKDSFFVSADETRPMYRCAQREIRRTANHQLISILKAVTDKDFIVGSMDKPGTINKVSSITVFFGGTRINLRVNTATGQVMSFSYRGRGPQSSYGRITKYISEFKKVAGVNLPHRAVLTFEKKSFGKPRTFEIAVNQKLDDASFSMKESGSSKR